MYLMTPEEAAKELKVAPETLRRWLRSGEFKAAKTPAGWRISEQDMHRFLATRHTGQPDDDEDAYWAAEADTALALSVWVSAAAKAKVEALAREKGVSLGEVVNLALERLDAGEVDATTHLMSSPANAARLTQAINDHRAGRNMQERELFPDAD